LDNSFKLIKENGGYVYFFFSCNASGKFAGVARMKGEVQHDKCSHSGLKTPNGQEFLRSNGFLLKMFLSENSKTSLLL
jgi:hypothetical protein